MNRITLVGGKPPQAPDLVPPACFGGLKFGSPLFIAWVGVKVWHGALPLTRVVISATSKQPHPSTGHVALHGARALAMAYVPSAGVPTQPTGADHLTPIVREGHGRGTVLVINRQRDGRHTAEYHGRVEPSAIRKPHGGWLHGSNSMAAGNAAHRELHS
jgi:hypothetical protein